MPTDIIKCCRTRMLIIDYQTLTKTKKGENKLKKLIHTFCGLSGATLEPLIRFLTFLDTPKIM